MDCAGSADLLNASIIAHFIFHINLLKSYNCSAVTVCGQEFYDLNADPDEIDSSAMKPQAKTVVETMRTMVEREIIHSDSTQIFLPGGEVPESEKKALQSLGYTE